MGRAYARLSTRRSSPPAAPATPYASTPTAGDEAVARDRSQGWGLSVGNHHVCRTRLPDPQRGRQGHPPAADRELPARRQVDRPRRRRAADGPVRQADPRPARASSSSSSVDRSPGRPSTSTRHQPTNPTRPRRRPSAASARPQPTPGRAPCRSTSRPPCHTTSSPSPTPKSEWTSAQTRSGTPRGAPGHDRAGHHPEGSGRRRLLRRAAPELLPPVGRATRRVARRRRRPARPRR